MRRAVACLFGAAVATATTPQKSRRQGLRYGAAIGATLAGRALLKRRAAAKSAPAVAETTPADGKVNRMAVARADSLMRQRTAASCEKAAAMYEAELEKSPDDAGLLLKAADAVNAAMRIRTDGNTITIDGTIETAARKAIWKQNGERALALAERGLAAGAKDARAFAIRFDSYMFSCSHKSLVKQALTGAGTRYKKMGLDMQKRFPKHDGDVGSAVLACFFHVAPWPVGSADAALENARKAVTRGGPTLRNLYYVAVISYSQGDYATAADYFQRALDAKPGSPSEADFAPFMKSESKRALKLAEAKIAS